MKCLLITSYFPPVIGGSAKVYDNIFKYGQGLVSVLTVSSEHADRKHDDLSSRELGDIYRIKYLMEKEVLPM